MNQKTERTNKKVLVFGSFDGLHEGHISFIKQARSLGTFLTVSLAKDETIKFLKRKKPKYSFPERKKVLLSLDDVDSVITGDDTLGEYRSVTNSLPNVIALGYDQTALKQDIKRWMQESNVSIPLKTLRAFKPETYKSSLLNNV